MRSIGLDVGGTKVLGVVVDVSGTVLDEHRVLTPSTDGVLLVAAMAEVVTVLHDRHGEVATVGAGVAGLITRDGMARFSPNLSGVVELPVAALLSEAVGLPVALDNDATCALRAEHRRGAARGVDDVALVALGTGVGGAFILDGELRRGASGFAGEIGHMVVDVGGVPCVCGRRGCWERYASGTGLGRMGREAAEAGRAPRLVELAGGDPLAVRGEHVTAAAAEGDAAALAVVDVLAGWVAIGLVNLCQALDVARFVIGGGLAEAGDVIIEPIRRAYDERAVGAAYRPRVEIVAAQLGEQAGAVGAALLAASMP
ncbi:MAG: glk [Acidimicrobiales bacterium]|nr:glk [Acidimicrobiales bacterium]